MSQIKLNLSVHQLVDFLLRKGDIDDRVFNNETMQEGSKIHHNFQRKQDSNYLSEINLQTTIKHNNYDIFLHGRADGVILSSPIVIDEIKTTNSVLEDFFDKNESWHLGQAECYAYIYAKNNNLNKIGVRLTYISQNNDKHFFKYYYYDLASLENIINDYIERYLYFFNVIEESNLNKRKSIKSLVFPFSLRKGQSEIIKLSQNSIENEDCQFVEASTGLGKTISILFGALKGSIKNNVDKMFFLCAKNSGFKSAKDALNELRLEGLKIKSCEIIGKEKVCFVKNLGYGPECNPEFCPYARDYYSKLNEIIAELFINNDDFTNEKILSIAREYEVCPFELSLDLSTYCDLIIADYNYVFHPISYLKRFFDELDYKYSKFLMIDEAHNIVDRSRAMYSASISYASFIRAKKDFVKVKNKSLKKLINFLDDDFDLFNKIECNDNNVIFEVIDQTFIAHLNNFCQTLSEYKKKHPKFKTLFSNDFSLNAYTFLKIYDLLGENYKIYFNKNEEDIFKIVLKCIDASPYIKDRINDSNGAIFFSGTLTPIDYYEKAILGEDTYQSKNFASPFEKNHLLLLVNNKISTKYKDRLFTIGKVIENIEIFISAKIGNYIIYVPSFEYLNLLKERLNQDNSINYIFQNANMDNGEKIAFLENFKANPEKTTVGICVLGGSFSEGVDLVADRLIGVVIVGVGLPSVNFENNLIKDYYNYNNIDGFTFAYVNPGINKIMQAVGRLIRSETDRGVALLIDERYSHKTYRFLFENIWKNYKIVKSNKNLENELISFYKD